MKTRIKEVAEINNTTAKLEKEYFPQKQTIRSIGFWKKKEIEVWDYFWETEYSVNGMSFGMQIKFKDLKKAEEFIKNKKLEGETIIN